MARRLSQLATIPVADLHGVGDKRASSLEKLGVETVLDLLMYYPRRYLDRTREARISDLRPGEEAMVLVTVRSARLARMRNGKPMVTVDVTDGTGSLKVTFFNQAFRERQLKPGTQAVLFGKLETFRGQRQMKSPVVDLIGDRTGKIVPVYPQSEKAGVMTWEIGRYMTEVLERAKDFADPVSDAVREHLGLIDRTRAFHDIHEPESMAAAQQARNRLVFDELLRVQVKLVQRKRQLEAETVGIRHDLGGALVSRFHERLPFPLTGAQQRAIREIDADLAAPHPMHRLLQGDVGAGKTLVAVSALLVAVQGGHQGALMAPTEVLAEQHAAGIRELLSGLTVAGGTGDDLFSSAGLDRELRVELLTNRTTAAERRALLAGLASGAVDLVIGTHALIQEGIELRSLGVVVIDEQHRFGVEQRAALRAKSATDAVPDVLVMTATPIPRTAAMTVYGDLDVSVLDELPPGRTPIETAWAQAEPLAGSPAEEPVWTRVREEVAAGRQAYVVCPLIEESDKLEVASAEETYAVLTAPGGELDGLRVGLLHGRVAPADKEATMGAFRRGELDVLVATTVIEVGVDVPNATAMVILDADRFGIAQLHQLRGRVGRGSQRSYCWLVGEATTPDGAQRLEAMVRTTDGFELAEVDLDIRGEGTIMGERQKGRNDLKLASLRRDRSWVVKAREVAFDIVGDDPTLAEHPVLAEEISLLLEDDETVSTEFLLKS
jgi:ATP-dependent DNA helicase RecG